MTMLAWKYSSLLLGVLAAVCTALLAFISPTSTSSGRHEPTATSLLSNQQQLLRSKMTKYSKRGNEVTSSFTSNRQQYIATLCNNFRQDLVIKQATHAAKPVSYCSPRITEPPVTTDTSNGIIDTATTDNTHHREICRRNGQYVAIGMVKSGTATLHRIAQRHPLIATHRSSERHFFDANRDVEKIQSVYHSYLGSLVPNPPHFSPQFVDLNTSIVYGEHTPSYMWQINYRCNVFKPDDCLETGFRPNVTSIIAKMKAVLPSDTLMAITIRNPVDRAFSHFAHFAGCDREKYTKHDKPQCFHDLVTSEMQRLEQCFTILGELNIECIHNPLNAVNKGARLVGLGLYAVFFQLWYQHFPNLCVMDVVSHGKNLEPAAHEFEQCLGISRTDARGVKDNYGVDWKNISHISQAQKFEPMYDLTRRMLEEFYKPYNQMLCHMVPHTCEWEWVRKSFD